MITPDPDTPERHVRQEGTETQTLVVEIVPSDAADADDRLRSAVDLLLRAGARATVNPSRKDGRAPSSPSDG